MAINFSGEIDLVATYAAVLSTLIAIWEFVKWKNRNAIKLTCNPNMKFMPSSDGKSYVIANVVNSGSTATTVTHFLAYYWPSRFHKIFRKKRQEFIINCTAVPALVNPGECWMGQAHQDEKIEKMAREGILYMGIIHSMGKNEVLRRVKISKKSI
ncbi:hypothetical protein N9W34_05520 [Rickettsiales bacterium]|nr:hypothetical protein [Rickettsiales bacterium]